MTNNLEPLIGKAGQKWNGADKKQWFNQQTIKRSYQNEVVNKIHALSSHFNITQYGALSIDVSRYPLFALTSKHWQNNNKTVLITGGVHGYETSGVQGAIRFLADEAAKKIANKISYFDQHVNVIVAPCISPWGYETINRWNPDANDPNRSFHTHSPAQESATLMAFIQSLNVDIIMHIDLHETTNTDNTVFRPALSARDAIEQKVWNIPDGFYLVGNTLKPQSEFQKAIITAVEKVTHIAPADNRGQLIGDKLAQVGVINYAARELGLCMGFTEANYVTTTEVYPDSPISDDENCIEAQVAAITAAFDFIIEHNIV